MKSNSQIIPRYIVIDGIDGGGKGTLLQKLTEVYAPLSSFLSYERCREEGVIGKYFVYTREPGGTELGEKLRTSILNDSMSSFSELCLLMAQRKELRLKNETALFSGLHVISDRSDSASFAYQIRGRNLEHLEDLFWEMNKYLAPFPSLYIFLDIDPKVAAGRMGQREASGQSADKFEKENVVFFEKVRQGFIDFSKKVTTPCCYVNAEQSKEKVFEEVSEIISGHIKASNVGFTGNVLPFASFKNR